MIITAELCNTVASNWSLYYEHSEPLLMQQLTVEVFWVWGVEKHWIMYLGCHHPATVELCLLSVRGTACLQGLSAHRGWLSDAMWSSSMAGVTGEWACLKGFKGSLWAVGAFEIPRPHYCGLMLSLLSLHCRTARCFYYWSKQIDGVGARGWLVRRSYRYHFLSF